MVRISLILFSGIAFSQLLACGPDCQSTCNKLYQTYECGIERPGTTLNERVDRCMDECNLALRKPGKLGDYNPNEETPRSEDINLENDQQAAAWMDCVKNTACENLERNFCAPVW